MHEFSCKRVQKTEFVRVMPSAAENVKEIGTLIDLGVKCLEGTTERSDGNRVRSARKGEARTMCLEGTTPKDIPHHCISANSSDRPGRHLSIATIRVYFCDDNGDNLRQLEVVLGATEMPRNILPTNFTNFRAIRGQNIFPNSCKRAGWHY